MAEVTTKSPDLNPKRMNSREKNGGMKRPGQWREENGGMVANEQEPVWCQKACSLGSLGLGERSGITSSPPGLCKFSSKRLAFSCIFPAATGAACSPAWKAFETLLPLQQKTLMQHPPPNSSVNPQTGPFDGSISPGSSLCSGYQNAL